MATTIGGITTSVTTPLAGTELMEFEQGGVTKKGTAQDVANLATIAVEDDGTPVEAAKTMNFTGAGVTVTETAPGVCEIAIPGGGGGSALEIQDEGSTEETATVTINFTGAGVSVTPGAPGVVQVVIPGGGGSALAAEDEGTEIDAAVVRMDFVGAGVTVTQTAAGQIQIAIPGAGAQPYDMGLYLSGLQADNTQVLKYVFPRAVDFAANFAGSKLHAAVAATASAVYTIKKNGSTIGTITVAASGTTGTFASSGGAAFSFAIGDTMEIITPTPQDATLASASITMVGSRA